MYTASTLDDILIETLYNFMNIFFRNFYPMSYEIVSMQTNTTC